MQNYLDGVQKPAGFDNSLNPHLFCLTCLAFCQTPSSCALVKSIFPSLSRLCSATFIHCFEKEATQPFISSPTASGGSSDKVAAQAGLVLVLILQFQFDPECCSPLCSCIFTHHGSLIYHEPYKESPDRVRNNQHHSINPCDHPHLRGVWTAVCVCPEHLDICL